MVNIARKMLRLYSMSHNLSKQQVFKDLLESTEATPGFSTKYLINYFGMLYLYLRDNHNSDINKERFFK